MEVSQRALAYMLLWALLCGALLGGIYDLFSFHRKTKGASPRMVWLKEKLTLPLALRRRRCPAKRKKREWLGAVGLFLGDVLFCLLFAVVAVLLLYYTNEGQFRLSVPAIMLLSFFLYRITLGRPIRCVFEILSMLLRALFSWTTAILLYPCRLLWRCLEKPRRAIAACGRRIRERWLTYVRKQKQKRADRRKKSVAPAAYVKKRRPPDGRTVFARGGYRPLKEENKHSAMLNIQADTPQK